jgi:spore germination protein YaaH
MSKYWSRTLVLALIFSLAPAISVASAQASSPPRSAASAATAAPESAVLRKFRDSGPPVMAQAAQLEATAPVKTYPATAVGAPNRPLTAVTNTRLFREVFGFAFASSLGDPTIGYPSWNFTLLSTVAYFGIHVDWTGGFSSGSALTTWNDPNGPVPGFIRTAHASGTKVVLTIAMFDSTPGTPNMCSALQRSDLTIQQTVAEIQAKGIDGVNVDYESNNTTCTEPGTGVVASSQSLFTNFVARLRAAMPAGSYLSVDTYSGAAGYRDSSGAYLGFFDIGALALYADSFFVMAYDMEYANWNAAPLNCPSFCIGPTAPLSTYLFNDSRTAAEYTAVVPASKIIMGIPYYGRKECVAVPDPNQIPANAEGTSVAADGYLDAQAENGYTGNTLYTIHRETRDPLSATRWDTFSSTTAGCNREMYWDDATALGNKYNLVINDHLRGAGIFALNYGGGAPELWNLINLKFGQCSQAALIADKTTPQIPGTSVTFTGNALCAGTGEFRFWLEPPGSSTFTLMQDHNISNTWTWNTTGQPLGTYTVQVDARNQGSSVSLDTYARMSFRLALCVTPTLTSDAAPPQLLGTVVTYTAAVTCQGTPEYRFWVEPPGGAWSIAQDYGPAATFRWDTSHLAYGNYNIGVHVRTAGTTVAYESVQSVPYSLTSCTTAALTTDKASPQPTGTQIALNGTAHCDGVPQFRFMIQSAGGAWTVVQDFGASSTFTWMAAGPPGTYNLELDAKSAAAPASTMASATTSYVVAGCSAVTLASNPASPQVPGPTVVLTGSATCPGAAQYRFWIHKPDGTVGVVQDYSPTATYSWNTTGLALGTYGLRVDARDANGNATYEAVATAYYVLADPACTAPTVTIDPAAPQSTGPNTVTFTATTTVCPQPLYELWMLPPGSSTWLLVQGYSSSSSLRWNTAGAPAGAYQLSVWVRDAYSGSSISSGLGGSYDAFSAVADSLTATPCTALTVTGTPTSPSASGTQVTITGSATCSHPNPLYEFWMLAQGSSTWRLVQGYSTSATFNWNSTGALAGTEQFGVWVRDASSAGVGGSGANRYDTYGSTAYRITTPSCTSVTATSSPVSPAAHGTGVTVTITAVPVGCTNPNPQYEFWMLAQGSTRWQLIRGYSTSPTYAWNTSGAPAGTEHFGVWIKDSASSAPYDSYVSMPFTLS